MKRLQIIIALTFVYCSTLFSQSCFPNGITFSLQAQIDLFEEMYPNCTRIEGDLKITRKQEQNAITDLSGISMIDSVGGNLEISTAYVKYPIIANFQDLNISSIGGSLEIRHIKATDLSGLECIETIGENLSIFLNENLTNLNGLENISYIGGDVTITFNNSLTSCEIQSLCDYLSSPNGSVNIFNNSTGCMNPPEIAKKCGIELLSLPYGNYYFFKQEEVDNFPEDYSECINLKGNLNIHGEDIHNINGLSQLGTVEKNLNIGNLDFGSPLLRNLYGLHNLSSIGGNLTIGPNKSLTDITALIALRTIGGKLSIAYNESLSNLTGIENVTPESIESLRISSNVNLSNCEASSICAYLEIPENESWIYVNNEGCNSKKEILTLCSLSNTNLESLIQIYPNPSSTLISIKNESGFEISSITIYNHLGKKILQKNENKELDISDISKGMYFIEFYILNQKVRKKFIVIK